MLKDLVGDIKNNFVVFVQVQCHEPTWSWKQCLKDAKSRCGGKLVAWNKKDRVFMFMHGKPEKYDELKGFVDFKGTKKLSMRIVENMLKLIQYING